MRTAPYPRTGLPVVVGSLHNTRGAIGLQIVEPGVTAVPSATFTLLSTKISAVVFWRASLWVLCFLRRVPKLSAFAGASTVRSNFLNLHMANESSLPQRHIRQWTRNDASTCASPFAGSKTAVALIIESPPPVGSRTCSNTTEYQERWVWLIQ